MFAVHGTIKERIIIRKECLHTSNASFLFRRSRLRAHTKMQGYYHHTTDVREAREKNVSGEIRGHSVNTKTLGRSNRKTQASPPQATALLRSQGNAKNYKRKALVKCSKKCHSRGIAGHDCTVPSVEGGNIKLWTLGLESHPELEYRRTEESIEGESTVHRQNVALLQRAAVADDVERKRRGNMVKTANSSKN